MLIGPKKRPALKEGDYHLIVNDGTETCKVFDYTGTQLHLLPALAKGVYGPGINVKGGDTPPGLYKMGLLYRTKPTEPQSIWMSYGALCWDLEEQEDQESSRGRAGIALHGGGTGARPHHLAPRQELLPTFGCIRMHNEDLEKVILPLTHEWRNYRWVKKSNNVWLSVYQDDK
jgi:hypothetical protein